MVSVIGFFFAIFSIPIISNLKISFLPANFTTAVILVVIFLVFAPLALWVASLVAKIIPIILQVAKFAAVGAFNTFLDWGILNLLIALTGAASGVLYSVFKGISFLAANSGSYFWNKYWTFKSSSQANAGEFTKFFAVSIVGLIINVGIASAVVGWVKPLGGFTPERWANVGALLATLVSLVWNFVGYKFLVFISSKKKTNSYESGSVR